jgi:SAM-dependent methyltransferase
VGEESEIITDEIMDFLITRAHYDCLIYEDNDPVHDPQPLQEYMNNWDGQDFIDELQITSETAVLEIGVGSGRLAIRVAPRCHEFYGIDISSKTIERAASNLSAYDHVNLICGDFLTYSFNMSFDVIYSSLTFMHIKDKRTAIQKVATLLNPGGLFVLSVNKKQDRILEFGDRKIKIYPDYPLETSA